MKLLSLFLIVTVAVTVAAARSPRRRLTRRWRRFRWSWFIDNNVKDEAGCNSSWSSAATLQNLQTNDHRILVDTTLQGGTTGDSSNVCLYRPPVVRSWPGYRVSRSEGEVAPEEWILGRGTVGECGQGGCCQWNPSETGSQSSIFIKISMLPILESEVFSGPAQWYETTTDCDGERPDLITG